MLNHPTTIGLKHNHAKGKSSQKSEVPCLAPKSVFKNTLQASNSKLTLAPKDRIESMAHSRWGVCDGLGSMAGWIGLHSVLFFAGRSSLEGLMMVTHKKNIWSPYNHLKFNREAGPLKSYRDPFKRKRCVFQPSFFKGELLMLQKSDTHQLISGV